MFLRQSHVLEASVCNTLFYFQLPRSLSVCQFFFQRVRVQTLPSSPFLQCRGNNSMKIYMKGVFLSEGLSTYTQRVSDR